MQNHTEFQEIAHSGGRLTIRIGSDDKGRRAYQLRWEHQRPVAAAIFAVYALPQGVAVAQMNLGGIGSVPNPPPVPGCYQVFIGSDSQGKFGQECPACGGYWRGDACPRVCPYCGIRAETHEFLTAAQRSYVKQYCDRMNEVLHADIDGEYVIDMDAVADAAGKDAQKPPFYYSEKSQQKKFTCGACGTFNDILGTFGYCERCGTRNDVQELSDNIVPRFRERINGGHGYEACVRDSVAVFDSLVGRLIKQLLQYVPMTASRRSRLENRRFHNLQAVAAELKDVFDIDIFEGLSNDDVEFAKLMFHRRHVYEHSGGEADGKYIADSGDTSVLPKQALRETQDSAHRIAGLVMKMGSNLQRGFHEILPPEEAPIQQYQRWAKKP